MDGYLVGRFGRKTFLEGKRPIFRGEIAVGLMICNLCETPWWSLWWHLILKPIYLLWCKTRYHLGPFHGDVRKVSHFFGLNVSEVLFNHPAMYWSVNWWSITHALMHFDMCVYSYIHILTDLKVFPKSYFSLLAPSIFPRKKVIILFSHHLGFDGSCCLFRSRRGLLIFIDEAEAFLCCRSRQSNAYVQAALFEPKIWSKWLYCWT